MSESTIELVLETERRRILRELEKMRSRAVDACVGPPRPTAQSKAAAQAAYAYAQGIITAMGIVAGVPIAKPGVDFPGVEAWKRDEDYRPSPPKAVPAPAGTEDETL